jgi:tetratricopeptide (TPR) repeat protein
MTLFVLPPLSPALRGERAGVRGGGVPREILPISGSLCPPHPRPLSPRKAGGRGGTCRAVAIVLLLLWASTAAAQPYDVDLVILRPDHRVLSTEAFRERFPRRVADQINVALGPHVQVTTTETHPNADTLRRDGLGASLDGMNAVTDRRTCFLRLRYEAGDFVVECRCVDGYTGLVSPRVVSARTGDREQLAALAAGLIANSFAVVGDVARVEADRAELRLLDGFGGDVRAGDVFAVSRVVVQEGRKLGQRVEWLVLEAEKTPQAGVVPCRIHRRYVEQRLDAEPGKTSFRALRLPAGNYPLELGLVDDQATGQPVVDVAARIRSAGREVDVKSDAQGLIRSKTPLDRLAIVTLSSGGKDFARVPVPLVGDRPVCRVRVGESDEETAREVRLEQWSARIVRDLVLVDQRFGDLSFEGRSLEAAKAHAQETIDLIDSETKDLRTEERELDRIVPGRTKRGAADLARLGQQRVRLVETIRSFDHAIAEREASDQRRKESIALAQRASLLESQARFDEALVLFDQALAKCPELKKVRERADALRAGWALHGKEHEQARKFLVETWPRLPTDEIPTHLVLAEQALETCRKVGDKLTPRRFLSASSEHLKKIAETAEPLRRSLTPEARDQLRMWAATVATLGRLNDLAAGP